jgi:hypothetical protein
MFVIEKLAHLILTAFRIRLPERISFFRPHAQTHPVLYLDLKQYVCVKQTFGVRMQQVPESCQQRSLVI